jgi:hypothetical protein
MEKKLYLVETVSMFRMRYVVEAKEAEHANDEVVCNLGDLREFSQQHIDENIFTTREISKDEYMRLFAEDNDYLESWSDEQKKQFINVIDYKE